MKHEMRLFEGTGVEIIIDVDGEPLFEVYSTGMALGQTKEAKGNRYARRDRIDENLLNAEITPVVRNGQLFINESQLYDLMLEMKTEKVKPFRKWITSEVLPSIRKTGSYSVGIIPQTLPEALRAYADEVEKSMALALENQEMKPKAEFFDAVADSKTAIDIGSAAKVLNMGIGRNGLFEILRDNEILMSNNQPYQRYIDKGYFRVIEQRYNKPDGSTHISIKTLVYQRGLDFIRKLLNSELNK